MDEQTDQVDDVEPLHHRGGIGQQMLGEEPRFASWPELCPPPPRPPDEICRCTDSPPVKLMSMPVEVSFNPIHCMKCNLEVAPETVPLTREVVQEIRYWRGLYDAVWRLWLDSGEYENWARAELENLDSAINRMGRDAQRSLDRLKRCYYHCEVLTPTEVSAPAVCPSCGNRLGDFGAATASFKVVTCDACSLAWMVSW